jgi:sigma-E factor negative regulatory protein RseC
MEASGCVAQKGTVEEISDNGIMVRVHRESSCGHCSAQSLCNLSGSGEKIIETGSNQQKFIVGETVEVVITRGMGNKAVFLGYFLPFLLVVVFLLLFQAVHLPEWMSGLLSLGMLLPYYGLLYLFRDRLNKSFNFTIRKLA